MSLWGMSRSMNGLRVKTQWPRFEEDELLAVQDVLRSGKVNYWTGIVGKEFESDFSKYIGVKYGIAVANGTLALELALKGLGLSEGDEVIVPSATFIATASSVVAVGATPVVADIDPFTHNITAESIDSVCSSRTKAVICVHLAGLPCEMDALVSACKKHKLFLVEDCAQSHGASYKGKKCGAFGDVSAFSFCQDKIMTTGGEGGIVLTNNDTLWKSMWSYKDHGKDYDAVFSAEHPPGFRWLHHRFGSNYRLTEMQAAIGIHQLRKLPNWLDRRRENAKILDEGLSLVRGLKILRYSEDFEHAYYKYYAEIDLDALSDGWTKQRVIQTIMDSGIPCFSGSCAEIYREKAFSALWDRDTRLSGASYFDSTSIMFLVDHTLSAVDMHETVRVVNQVMTEATS